MATLYLANWISAGEERLSLFMGKSREQMMVQTLCHQATTKILLLVPQLASLLVLASVVAMQFQCSQASCVQSLFCLVLFWLEGCMPLLENMNYSKSLEHVVTRGDDEWTELHEEKKQWRRLE